MAMIALKAVFPADWQSWDSQGIQSVAIVPNWVHRALTIVMAASALCMLVWAVVADQHGLIRIVVAVLAIVLPPAALIMSLLFNLGPWTIEATTVGPDSKSYSFLNISFLQGQVMAIAYETHDWLVLREFQVIGSNNGDSPQSWASVIRPAGAPDDYGQFYWSKDGQLVAIRHDDECFMAYTPSTGTFLGHDKIETLSPFVLIDSQTGLHAPDVQESRTDSRGGQTPARAVRRSRRCSKLPIIRIRKSADSQRCGLRSSRTRTHGEADSQTTASFQARHQDHQVVGIHQAVAIEIA